MFAVNEWIASGLPFHGMRDHLGHGAPIMAGMMGMARNTASWNGVLGDRGSMAALIALMLDKEAHDSYYTDQAFLERRLWPLVRNVSIYHDSDTARCKRHKSLRCQAYPFQAPRPVRPLLCWQQLSQARRGRELSAALYNELRSLNETSVRSKRAAHLVGGEHTTAAPG